MGFVAQSGIETVTLISSEEDESKITFSDSENDKNNVGTSMELLKKNTLIIMK